MSGWIEVFRNLWRALVFCGSQCFWLLEIVIGFKYQGRSPFLRALSHLYDGFLRFYIQDQEWIQDFPDGGCKPRRGTQPIIRPNFPENCMKFKKIAGGASKICLNIPVTGDFPASFVLDSTVAALPQKYSHTHNFHSLLFLVSCLRNTPTHQTSVYYSS